MQRKRWALIFAVIHLPLAANAQSAHKSIKVGVSTWDYDSTKYGIEITRQGTEAYAKSSSKRTVNYRHIIPGSYSAEKVVGESFKEVFSRERINELKNERIILSFHINHLGKITTVKFEVNHFSKITPQEISSLEASLQKNVSFKVGDDSLTSKDDGHFPALHQIVKFKALLDETFQY